MGAVNAVATVAAVLPAVLWWLALRPNPRWWRFTAWWLPCLLLATGWWLVALLLLGRVSPPFLDFIESAGVTTQWASLPEVLRGTTSWTPFVSPERVAGAVLVTQPAAVIATGVVAAAGMAGLAMRAMPAKGRLTLILLVGLAGITAGYVGGLGSPFAESVRAFLDAGGAPLRNVHKLEPLIRLPLVLGLAHLLARVPLPGSVPARRWRSALAHPEREPMVAVAGLVLVALAMSTALAWTGRLAPRGAYEAVPQYWHEAADWLADNADGQRALVVPGAPFASQVWGLTRDEPLQALAQTPWAVRDAIPLNPPGAIRALDSVQRLFADGRGSAGLAATLADQGIAYLVVRNDLDPDTSRSARPVSVHQTLAQSGGFERVATFGADVEAPALDGVVTDSDLRPSYPAVEVFRGGRSVPLHTEGPSAGVRRHYLVDVDTVPRVQGGPEAVLRMRERGGSGPTLLAADAAAAGLPVDDVTVTDTPMDRETDYGQVDHHSSAVRADGDERRTYNRVPDYPVPGADLVRGEWSGARITVSSSASDATQLGGTRPGSGPPATVDGDTATSWLSNGLESAVGQWLQLDLDTPIASGLLRVTTSTATIGSPVKWIEIRTPNGTAAGRITEPGAPITIALPPGTTPWIRITRHPDRGRVGGQPVRHRGGRGRGPQQPRPPRPRRYPPSRRAAAHPRGRRRDGMGSRSGTVGQPGLCRGARPGPVRTRPRAAARGVGHVHPHPRRPDRHRGPPGTDRAHPSRPDPGRPAHRTRPRPRERALRRRRPPRVRVRRDRWRPPHLLDGGAGNPEPDPASNPPSKSPSRDPNSSPGCGSTPASGGCPSPRPRWPSTSAPGHRSAP